MGKKIIPVMVLALLITGGCTKKKTDQEDTQKQDAQQETTQQTDASQTQDQAKDQTQKQTTDHTQPGIVNPASKYCTDNGGKLEMKTNGKGDQYGVCVFENNQQCEEWAFFRGFCPKGGVKITGLATPAAEYCAIQGGEYTATRETPKKDEKEQGNCTFKNGAECDVWDMYNAKCPMHFNEPATSWVYKKYNDPRVLIGYQDQVIKLISGNVSRDEKKPQLKVDSARISNIAQNAASGYDQATAKKDQGSLAKGDYGAEIDSPIQDSKKVVKIYPAAHGKEFMVLSRDKECDVAFERTVIFYNNDHRVIVTLYGNKEEIMKENPGYFKHDDKCKGKTWNYHKSSSIREEFEKDLQSGKINKGNATESWYGQFDMIVETIGLL